MITLHGSSVNTLNWKNKKKLINNVLMNKKQLTICGILLGVIRVGWDCIKTRDDKRKKLLSNIR